MYWLIALLIAIVLFFFFLRVFKKFFKALLLIFILIIIFLAITSGLVYSDVTSIITDIDEKPILLLAHNQGELMTGISFKINEEEFKLLSDQDINNYKSPFLNKNYDLILGNNFKIVSMDINKVSEIIGEETKIIEGIKVPKEEIINILKSDQASKDLKTILRDKLNIPNNTPIPLEIKLNQNLKVNLNDNSQVKATLLGISLSNSNFKNPENIISLIIDSYKEDEIEIYPETITFKIAKDLPSSLYRSIISVGK